MKRAKFKLDMKKNLKLIFIFKIADFFILENNPWFVILSMDYNVICVNK